MHLMPFIKLINMIWNFTLSALFASFKPLLYTVIMPFVALEISHI